MIRKIKKYKISVRPFGVLRQFKKQLPPGAAQEPPEAEVEAIIARVQPHVTPCALYASYSKSETPAALQELWKSSPEKSLTLSVIAATIGSAVESVIERDALWNSVARESLEQSFNFVEKLISEEAVDESCELTSLLPASAEQAGPLLQALESHKADIIVNDSGQVIPLFTGLRYCFWTPLRGKNAKK